MIWSKDKEDMKPVDCNMNLALNKHVPEKHKIPHHLQHEEKPLKGILSSFSHLQTTRGFILLYFIFCLLSLKHHLLNGPV